MARLAALLFVGGAAAFAPVPAPTAPSTRAPACLTSLRMTEERPTRRSALLPLLSIPLAAALPARPAAAQFEIFGDTKGERPAGLGPRGDKFLSLCDSENCVSTSDDVYSKRYLPPWVWAEDGKTKPMEQARAELMAVLKDTKGCNIIKEKDNYIYAEFERELGLVDDVEFLLVQSSQQVEYRSASRKKKKSDHRARIRAIRLALQPKGWKSVGYRCESYSYNAMGDKLCEKRPAKPQLTKEENDLGLGR